MPLVPMRQILDEAAKGGYGVGAFNVNNMEQVQAIMRAADAVDSPVILQGSAGARSYAGEPFLRHLIEESTDVDVVVPRLGGQPEPLHALYSKACLAPMEEMLRAGDLKIAPLFEAVRVRYLDEETIDSFDPDHLSFFNINTKADLAEAQRLLREVGSCSALPPGSGPL